MKRLLLTLLLLSTSISCFERTVDERLSVELAEEGNAVVKSVITLNEKGDEKKKVKARLDALRDVLLNGRDEWSHRFATVEWEEDRVEQARAGGKLYRVTRTGTTSRDQLHRLFNDFAVMNFTRGAGWEELTISPLATTRATAKQREEVEKTLDQSADTVAAYLQDVARFYEYLKSHPHRARDTFALLLSDVIADDVQVGEIMEEEKEMIERINEHFKTLSAILDPEEEAAYSLDELSLLVYDPFPADITIQTPGRIVTATGFEQSEESVTLRRAGLWESTAELQSKWIEPDPVLLWVDAWRDEKKQKLDLEAIVATPRRVEKKSSTEIRAAIVNALKPLPRYSVRWEAR